jgi:hypothetical protein
MDNRRTQHGAIFTRASRTSPSISRFTRCVSSNVSKKRARSFILNFISMPDFVSCVIFRGCDELWTNETFCLLPRGWISQQFQMPDLRVVTLDSLLTISDNLTKVRYVCFAVLSPAKASTKLLQSSCCWINL